MLLYNPFLQKASKLFCLSLISLLFTVQGFSQQGRSVANFDKGWHFHLGKIKEGENVNLYDGRWRTLSLPHDWSIEDLPGTSSPFNPDAISQVSGGFTTGGTGWYRKTFFLPCS